MAGKLWARGVAALVVGLCVWGGATLATASERIETTEVTRVIDGDTFVVAGDVRVRVRNFDTPELRRYECRSERTAAVAARDAARRLLQGQRVTLRVTGEDRYRRQVADVSVHRGARQSDFVAEMVAQGHGARWDYGNEPQPEWCQGRERVDEYWRVLLNRVERSLSGLSP
ncbi:MAG: thermonuclease family protein [Pseudomonadota bacterium]